jgi:hypothetical protein
MDEENQEKKPRKNLQQRHAEILESLSEIEATVYRSNISPRHKALRSTMLPAILGIALLVWLSAPWSAYAFSMGFAVLIALLICKEGHATKRKVQIEPGDKQDGLRSLAEAPRRQ